MAGFGGLGPVDFRIFRLEGFRGFGLQGLPKNSGGKQGSLKVLEGPEKTRKGSRIRGLLHYFLYYPKP